MLFEWVIIASQRKCSTVNYLRAQERLDVPKNSLKTTLKDLQIDTETWEALATDRAEWRCNITKGAKAAESSRITEAEKSVLHAKANPLASPYQTPFLAVIVIDPLRHKLVSSVISELKERRTKLGQSISCLPWSSSSTKVKAKKYIETSF